MKTVLNEDSAWKDTTMKLQLVLTAVLALTLAEEKKGEAKKIEIIEDSAAEATNVELLKDGGDMVKSAYNYVPNNHYGTQGPIQPVNTWVQPAAPAAQNDYHWVSTEAPFYPTTPKVPILFNEAYYGQNGDYSYKYKTGDGTYVGEQGWFSDPEQTEESLVKTGWYSLVGTDGLTYTVTWRADNTGYHAYGSHLPYQKQPQYQTQTTAPNPSHPTTQPPTYTTTPRPIYPVEPTYPVYPAQQQVYYPTEQPTYYPQQQPTYNQPQQQNYYPNYNV